MPETKSWFLSKTIWGSLIAVAAAIASVFGFDVDKQMQQSMAEVALQVVTVVASLFAVFGRLSATHEIA